MNEPLVPFFRTTSALNAGVFERDTLIRHAVALAIIHRFEAYIG